MTQSIHTAALYLLTGRDYSQKELIKKLKNKGYASSDIDAVLPELIQKGYLDDQRFTENYIQKRRNKGYGPYRIKVELQNLGITEELIAENLQIADNAWFVEIRRIWQKHFKGKLANNTLDHAKQMRFLLYRGFTSDQIESVMSG